MNARSAPTTPTAIAAEILFRICVSFLPCEWIVGSSAPQADPPRASSSPSESPLLLFGGGAALRGVGTEVGSVTTLSGVVGALVSLEGIVALSTDQRVVRRATLEDVVSVSAEDQVTTAEALDLVVSALAADDVLTGSSVQGDVVARRSVDGAALER